MYVQACNIAFFLFKNIRQPVSTQEKHYQRLKIKFPIQILLCDASRVHLPLQRKTERFVPIYDAQSVPFIERVVVQWSTSTRESESLFAAWRFTTHTHTPYMKTKCVHNTENVHTNWQVMHPTQNCDVTSAVSLHFNRFFVLLLLHTAWCRGIDAV